MSGGGRPTLAMFAGIVGGLLLGGSTTVDWFAVGAEREVGGVMIPDERGVAGGTVAAELLPVGLAVCVVALSLVVARGRLRQGAGGALLVLAVGAAWLTLRPFLADPPGTPAAGAAMAMVGTLGAGVAGVLVLRPAAPPSLSARYDLDTDDADDEWRLASADELDTPRRTDPDEPEADR